MYIRFIRFCDDLLSPILVGIMVGLVLFGCIFIFLDVLTLSVGVLTNIVIALASIIAVLVHGSGLYTQERSRRWELRKGIVFGLLNALSNKLELTKEMYNIYMDLQHMQEDELDEMPRLKEREKELVKSWNELSEKLNNQVRNILNVYKTVMTKEFSEYIDKYNKNISNLNMLSRQEWVEHDDLFENEIKILSELQAYLFGFVADESGLN
ncbi:hypothetical protein ACRN9O_08615 [Shewanella oncorhynchi]|uniref:hypothetical protein n=1 Tax=Shewanella oncorhynchi TaxID=2726434 RepID=UPI003D7B0723